MNDRDQKQKALRYSVACRWLPQLEVDVSPEKSVAEKAPLVTDLDVFSSRPDQFQGFRTIVFDCKTKKKESPVNRCLWLCGVLDQMNADQGFCILRRSTIELDHRLMATRRRIILLDEAEFDLYASATSTTYSTVDANVACLESWEKLFSIPQQYQQLASAMKFTRSDYWMIEDAAEACRKTLSILKAIHPELDPRKAEHAAVFFEFCCLFSRSLAVVVSQLFKVYLQPAEPIRLSEPLLTMLYGGRDAYDHRNSLFRLVKEKSGTADVSDLALPEWDRFVQLVRQLLDAPSDAQHVPLILRELGFSAITEGTSLSFVATLCAECPQAGRFALMVPGYLCRAAGLPSEFARLADEMVLPHLTTP